MCLAGMYLDRGAAGLREQPVLVLDCDLGRHQPHAVVHNAVDQRWPLCPAEQVDAIRLKQNLVGRIGHHVGDLVIEFVL